MFKVMSRPCDQCLLTPERIVSGRRAAEIIRETKARNCHFVCHKSKAGRNSEIACRAHHDLGIGQMSRIANRLGGVVEIDPQTLAPVMPSDGATVAHPLAVEDAASGLSPLPTLKDKQ